MRVADVAVQVSPQGGATGHLALLQRVTQQMTVHRRLGDVLGAITRGLLENADAALARIWLYAPAAACAVCREKSGDDPQFQAPSLHLCASAGVFEGVVAPHHDIPLGMFLSGHVAESREPLLLNDLPGEPRVRELPWIAEHGLQAYAGYPLLFNDELEGVLGIFRRQPWQLDEFRALSIFALQASIAIKNATLIEEAENRSKRLSLEKEYLEDEIRQHHGFGEIVGRSAALADLLQKVEKVAPTDTTVLLLGETGTGKELLARAIHGRSSRRDRPLIKVNCGAISPGLVESELFGHEKGSFTGAFQRRLGRFELANGGTLFLDEVGDLPHDVQVKLLRVLQEGEFERVGGTASLHSDARIIAATNHDLQADVAAGRFRTDLFYRLSVFPMRLPSLRDRVDDLELLVQHFLAHFEMKLHKPLRSLAPESLERLKRYSWPGNIRELQNVLERACVLTQTEVVQVMDSFGQESSATTSPTSASTSTSSDLWKLEDVVREHILRVLGSTGGVIQGPHGAARILGVHPNTLRSRMERLGIHATHHFSTPRTSS